MSFDEVVAYACAHVPFYQRLPAQERAADKLPCVTRRMVADNTAEFLAETYEGNELYRDSTSGRSGTALSVYGDMATHAARQFLLPAELYRAIPELSDMTLGAARSFLGIVREGHQRRRRPMLNPMLRFSAMRNHCVERGTSGVADLVASRNPLINGLPMVLQILCERLREMPRYLSEVRRSIKAVVSSGDNLLPADRASMEETFQAPVYNGYFSTEGNAVGIECAQSRGTLHVLDDLVRVEVIRQIGEQPSPSGYGEIVVTNKLFRPMMFLRYRTGDFGELADGCSCGWTRKTLKRIDGRVFVLFEIGDRQINPYDRLDPIFHAAGIDRYRVTQHKVSGNFHVEYAPRSSDSPDARIAAELRSTLLDSPLTIERVAGFRDRKHLRYRIEGSSFARR